jgi:putative restriction endonuclease
MTFNLVRGGEFLKNCLGRAEGSQYWNVEPLGETITGTSERYGSPIAVRPRLGQGLFSLAVRNAYNGACAITREHSMPVLEAAHIMPYARGGEHRVDNGLLLRRDPHRLYDRGHVTITADHVFRVGDRLRDEFKNWRSYYDLSGTTITVPRSELWHPSRELLDWHANEVFKG